MKKRGVNLINIKIEC